MNTDRKVIVYISMSLDGYIADKNDNLNFLSLVEQEGEDYGYNEFVNTVDTIIIGRKTYDKVLSMGFEYPHTDKSVYIISRKSEVQKDNLIYYNQDLKHLINDLKSKPGKNIYCDGGAEIINLLQNECLIDEYIISVIPILLGEGINLFKKKNIEQKLTLLSAKSFKKGLVQLHYKCEY